MKLRRLIPRVLLCAAVMALSFWWFWVHRFSL